MNLIILCIRYLIIRTTIIEFKLDKDTRKGEEAKDEFKRN